MKKNKVHIIIQARSAQKGWEIKFLWNTKAYRHKIMIERLKNCKNIEKIIVCTTIKKTIK